MKRRDFIRGVAGAIGAFSLGIKFGELPTVQALDGVEIAAGTIYTTPTGSIELTEPIFVPSLQVWDDCVQGFMQGRALFRQPLFAACDAKPDVMYNISGLIAIFNERTQIE